MLAVSSLYGIELLADNVAECRKRLSHQFAEHYQSFYPKSHKAECCRSVDFILSKNILCGDALSLKTADNRDIVFTEWKMIGNQFKQRDFIYRDLVENLSDLPLFSDQGEQAFIPQPIKDDYPLTHFLELGND